MDGETPDAPLFIELMEPSVLYNLLNRFFKYPSISDPSYLLLIDARKLHEYNESHIVTAKLAPKNKHDQFEVPYDGELECKQFIVVYDGTTDTLTNTSGEAMKCAQLLSDSGSRNKVKILSGGYERFSALYPFLRTQKILWLPQELDGIKTYPMEVLPGLLYLGNTEQGRADYIQKDLKIQGRIACNVIGESCEPDSCEFLNLVIPEDKDADLSDALQKACTFIDLHRDKKSVVLVYSDLMYASASTICIAYLMHQQKSSLQESLVNLSSIVMGTHVPPHHSLLNNLSDKNTAALTSEA
ncbi:serine/threonine/tyrosine-interacting-like protein 1 [Watersipora subatra]|uniref:serine/threonine/tyrosine-interacting-like protein 1 n=1 Tax=Watersipora subatra TaxID=2589382 RepID=UPI00355AFCF1